MKKNVLVSITSQHSGDGSDHAIQTLVHGTYSYIQGKHVIRYEEILEERSDSEPATTLCILKIAEDNISLTKHGQANTEMYFKQGEAFNGLYDTPFGCLQMRLCTLHLSIKESPGAISAELDYGLELNQSHVGDCCLKIEITFQE